VLQWIYRIADRYQSLPVRKGSFRGLNEGSIRIVNRSRSEVLPLAKRLYLYRSYRGRSYLSPRLPLAVGDEVIYHVDSSGAVDLILLESLGRGVADDRSSSYYQWEARYTRQELEDLIAKRVDVGRLADVTITRRGVSGRVTQVKISGSRGTFTLSGFKIRTALGIRENLFTMEKQIDPGGGVRSFNFAGKGWGHGVGLCQVGGYGMALRGATFDQILRHYYSGIDLIRYY
jgi:stage II sporulation protein D